MAFRLGAVLIPLGFVLAFLSGCTTPYQAMGAAGGFSEAQLGENVWRVTFRGNAYTDRELTRELALLRSAELALANGFNFFILTDSSIDNRTASFTTPLTAQTRGTATTTGYGNGYGGFDASTRYKSTTTFSGGETIVVVSPAVTTTATMFKDMPQINGTVYDARLICNSVGKRYEVNCGGTAR